MARKEQMLAGIDYDGSIIVGAEKNDYINRPCTVVVHDGDKHERVFTESEVRVLISALKDAAMANSVELWIDQVAQRILAINPA